MSLSSLKSRLIERLDAPASWQPDAVPVRSDYDLNPGHVWTDGPLRPAAVLIPVIARPEGASVLLTRRSDALASHTGQIAFPGGRLEAGEDAVQAALREAFEEVALDPAAVQVLGLGDGYRTVTDFRVTPVIGWLDQVPETRADPAEVAEVFEVPWDFLMDPANHRHDHYDTADGTRRHFWAMPYGDRYIWGATAAMIRALRVRVHGEDIASVGREDAA